MARAHGNEGNGHARRLSFPLLLVTLGVVYGDIGTSPLYALRECFHGPHAVVPVVENVFGALSLMFWALVTVISVKYMAFVLRADNDGEGGILALAALLQSKATRVPARWKGLLILAGLFGASLLYGDGMITPAISVLSAVEGLAVATDFFEPYIQVIAIVILVGLFMLQSRGTAGVGILFGPVMVVWFSTLAVLGLVQIVEAPRILLAINPVHAVEFFANNGWEGYLVLGAVFLVVTGGEALYADLGHFGARPIRLDWYFFVLPALLMNYFGQGAYLIENPEAAVNTFYALAPWDWFVYPLVVLATMATVIASQAVISGVFSLTLQAVQLGYAPRVPVDHTSPEFAGQIYIGVMNWFLMLSTITLVIVFRTSSNLAAAYGVAVSLDMMIATTLLFVVMLKRWDWPLWIAGSLAGLFLVIDVAFFGANVVKIGEGGWFPLVLAAGFFLLATTWKRGRAILGERFRTRLMPLDEFLANIERERVRRVEGTAVFMTGNPEGAPLALLHNLKHNHVLHERVVLLTVVTEDVPHVRPDRRVEVEDLGHGFWRVVARYGFMQDPNVPAVLDACARHDLEFDLGRTTFFLGRETLLPTARPGMARWREHLFAVMSRNAQPATAYFRIPADRVVEVGMQIEL